MNMNMSMSTTMYTNTSPYTKGSQSLIPRLILALDLTAEVKWMTSSILACRIYLLMIPSRERRHRRRLIPNRSALDAHPSRWTLALSTKCQIGHVGHGKASIMRFPSSTPRCGNPIRMRATHLMQRNPEPHRNVAVLLAQLGKYHRRHSHPRPVLMQA